MREFGTTIFAEMSALALATGSINLGQGFPDTDGPARLLADAVNAINTGHNQYPPGLGIAPLRQAISAHQQRHYALSYDPDSEVLVTAGATEAIAAAVCALAGPGDEVIVFEPYYDSYTACVALAGARRRVVTLRRQSPATGHNPAIASDPAPDVWAFDPDELRAAITPATRVIMLNTPHNPTGKVFTAPELALIAELAVEHDLIVIADEVYEHLVFDGRAHTPIATLPQMRERTVQISSAGKTFSVTGWKIGWVCAPPPLLDAVKTVKQFLTYVNGAPFQVAVAAALSREQDIAQPRISLQHQRNLLCDGLRSLGWDVIVPQATYFATVDIGRDGAGFCRELPGKAGVVAIPSSVFYDSPSGDHYVRFAFCKKPEVLRQALGQLAAARQAGVL